MELSRLDQRLRVSVGDHSPYSLGPLCSSFAYGSSLRVFLGFRQESSPGAVNVPSGLWVCGSCVGGWALQTLLLSSVVCSGVALGM